MNVQRVRFPYILARNNPRWADIPLQSINQSINQICAQVNA